MHALTWLGGICANIGTNGTCEQRCMMCHAVGLGLGESEKNLDERYAMTHGSTLVCWGGQKDARKMGRNIKHSEENEASCRKRIG